MRHMPFPLVKTEAAPGDCPLQGLLNCLKEIPNGPDRRPSPSGASDLQLQGDPGKGRSGGKGHSLGQWWELELRGWFRCSEHSRVTLHNKI